MKQLSDYDLEKMLDTDFVPDDDNVKKQVRSELKLSQLIPEAPKPIPKHVILDLHQKTEEQAWVDINNLIKSGVRGATVITGASGILKVKFQDWVMNSIISKYIYSCEMVNNGSFEIKIKKNISID
ncbi:MAG: Smr/MutS family protein [Alphaproteobacteria bacterium]|nr:Smr/MutS family protein [Alphaproteobacteria bacterium]MBN2674891.1 Smr/MutS family protein [Alphaproteobacteria bacterium]